MRTASRDNAPFYEHDQEVFCMKIEYARGVTTDTVGESLKSMLPQGGFFFTTGPSERDETWNQF